MFKAMRHKTSIIAEQATELEQITQHINNLYNAVRELDKHDSFFLSEFLRGDLTHDRQLTLIGGVVKRYHELLERQRNREHRLSVRKKGLEAIMSLPEDTVTTTDKHKCGQEYIHLIDQLYPPVKEEE